MIKLEIVSGFLGAGKTTFINNMLKGLRDEKIILVENEYGETAIDSDLIRGIQIEEITSGCICCVLKENFRTTLEKLVDYNVDRIIIEPTGISSLSQIKSSLTQKVLSRCEVSSTTIVDCENFLEQLDSYGGFFTDQIEGADEIYLSKADKVDDTTIARVKEEIKILNREADLEDLSRVKTISLIDYEMSPEKFRKVLDTITLGGYGRILRGKGFLGNMVFNIVHGRYEISEKDFKTQNKLTLIGIFEGEEIKKLFKEKIDD